MSIAHPKDSAGALTLEQQFQLRAIADQTKKLTLEEAQQAVVEIARQMMVRENLVKHLLKNAL